VALFGDSDEFIFLENHQLVSGHDNDRRSDYVLNMAFEQRDVKPGFIIHSDQGVQYRAQIPRFDAISWKKYSMSRKGNYWDTPMESFFSCFKVELIYAEQYQSIEEAKSGIFDDIEIFQNRLRRHSAIGYVSPVEFERLCAQSHVYFSRVRPVPAP